MMIENVKIVTATGHDFVGQDFRFLPEVKIGEVLIPGVAPSNFPARRGDVVKIVNTDHCITALRDVVIQGLPCTMLVVSSEISEPVPRSIDPDFADRFFGEKIISRDYKRLLVVLVDQDNTTHVWRGCDGQYCDSLGLARIAIMQTEDSYSNADGHSMDPENGEVGD